jgi:hypothetical protein
MRSESGQKETPAPVTVAKGGRGSSGVDADKWPATVSSCQTAYRENSCFRFDLCRILTQVFPSKPAGPLSQDTLSLGGSFFFRKEVSP